MTALNSRHTSLVCVSMTEIIVHDAVFKLSDCGYCAVNGDPKHLLYTELRSIAHTVHLNAIRSAHCTLIGNPYRIMYTKWKSVAHTVHLMAILSAYCTLNGDPYRTFCILNGDS